MVAQGSRCVVVGATGGIGRQVVHRMVEAGAQVHALGRQTASLAALAGDTGCATHTVDITDGERLAGVLSAIGDVDVLVFAAGVGGAITPFQDTDRSNFEQTMAPNVTGLLNTVHAVLPSMLARGSGHLVIIGSIAGLHPVASPTYAASKGATHAFAQSLTMTLAGSGVRVTEVCPGRVNTDCMPLANPGVDVRSLEPDSAALLQPDDVAAAVMYAVGTPARVNVGLIELVPSRQALGGPRFVADMRPNRSATEQEGSVR